MEAAATYVLVLGLSPALHIRQRSRFLLLLFRLQLLREGRRPLVNRNDAVFGGGGRIGRHGGAGDGVNLFCVVGVGICFRVLGGRS